MNESEGDPDCADMPADTNSIPAVRVGGCPILADEWPPLLVDLVSTWGSSVDIDPLSATAIILTFAGGIAGNSVKLRGPLVGELGPNLQLAVIRDKAPALHRGLQRITDSFDMAIVDLLRCYEHLSDVRSQRTELCKLESLLCPLLSQREVLEKTLEDDKAMMNAFCKQQDVQMRQEYERLCKGIELMRSKLRALRFRMKPMVLISELGSSELDELERCSFDRSILEIATSPGYFDRMLWLNERSLARLSAFRRNAECGGRLEFSGGRYFSRSSISTLLLVEKRELQDALQDRVMARSGALDGMFVCSPSAKSFRLMDRADPGDEWARLVSRLFALRLDRDVRFAVITAEARDEFIRVRQDLLNKAEQDEQTSRLWSESGPTLVAKLALCVCLFRNPRAPQVEAVDIRIAEWVGKELLETTSRTWLQSQETVTGCQQHNRERSEPDLPDPITTMVSKVRRIGPCSTRTLFRSYSAQDYTQLMPILDRAVELGLIEREGKTVRFSSPKLELVSVSPSVCQSLG